MTFRETKSTDALIIVGPRDTEFTRSKVPSIPPVSLERGWVRPRELEVEPVPEPRSGNSSGQVVPRS